MQSEILPGIAAVTPMTHTETKEISNSSPLAGIRLEHEHLLANRWMRLPGLVR